ncbi:hypothetical protein [Halobellus limi]|jgi:hypothetical protein|uniref:Uncharacterized protein n=1 Tax=Halobellus limi TaxID=699433 RepID=A0A1H6C404_9EURY|nr:hypothetical protein [Halobellus limi]SEG67096.1 hypothetical protein SAMN04488133_3152 [Halobellus limi]
MARSDEEPNNPLSPYYPSEIPDVPANGRTWFAILLAAMLLLGAAYGFIAMLL